MHYSLVFVVFCPTAGLQISIGKLKIVGNASFLSTGWRSLKEGPNKTPYRNILFEAVFSKVFGTNAPMLRGRKAILFYCHKPFPFKFWVLGKHQRTNFGFWVVSFEIYRELETKTNWTSNFPHQFSNSPTVTSQVLFPTIIRQFSRPLYDYKRLKNGDCTIFQYLQNASSNSTETSECV